MEDIKIVLLKSRQQIICKISELLNEETQEPLCFLVEVPLAIYYNNSEKENSPDVTIMFQQWMPFSSSLQFRIPFDYVVTIGEPKEQILEKYIETIKPYYPIIGDTEPNKLTEEKE
jgi:hypothetical protein